MGVAKKTIRGLTIPFTLGKLENWSLTTGNNWYFRNWTYLSVFCLLIPSEFKDLAEPLSHLPFTRFDLADRIFGSF